MELAFIDHYDSFSGNVAAWLKQAEPSLCLEWVAFDDAKAMARLMANPKPLVLSPGPKSAEDAQSTLELIKRSWDVVPMLGICLGHQLLAYSRGGKIHRHPFPHHGDQRDISLRSDADLRVFEGLSQRFSAGVYNSLSVAKESFPEDDFQIAAEDDWGEVQAMVSRDPHVPLKVGVQFHPESFLSPYGLNIALNWFKLIKAH